MADDALETHASEVLAIVEAREMELGRELIYLELSRIDEEVTYSWLEQERFDELIEYILYQFEHGGGRELWNNLRMDLEAKKDISRLHRLFRGLIPGRVSRFWIELPQAKKGLVGNIANAAHHKGEALGVMCEYYRVMYLLEQKDIAEKIQEDILLLNAEKKPKAPKPRKETIDDPLFWKLIEDASNNAPTSSAFAHSLKEELIRFSSMEICRFQQLLMQRYSELASWDLWAFAYIARGGCSDDAFDYFKYWIIAQGKATFEAATSGVDCLLSSYHHDWNLQCEELAYVADEAYFGRQGKPMKSVAIRLKEIVGEQWNEGELAERYPEVWDHFNPKG